MSGSSTLVGMCLAIVDSQPELALIPFATNGLSYLNVQRNKRKEERDLELAETNPIDFIFNELKSQNKGLRKETKGFGEEKKTVGITNMHIPIFGIDHRIFEKTSSGSFNYNCDISGIGEAVKKAKEKFPGFEAHGMRYRLM